MAADTIVALSSGALPAGVAVIRLSGPGAGPIVRAMTGDDAPTARKAVLRELRGIGGDLLDRGLVLWFPAPHSYTGEDVAELQVHGGTAVVAAVIAAATVADGARLAEPGEFTRRAFDNGRLDLTAVEGLADLIAARTEAQRRSALRQADGGLGRMAENWRAALIRVSAHLEAAIDFADEDLPDDLVPAARSGLSAIRDEITAVLTDGRRGELIRDGVQVALVGPPNVGKSSLLNRLARRDVAIVSDRAGTTRDVVEVTLDIAGFPAIIADTAGLRSSGDAVEAEGVARAEARRRQADIPIYVLDARDVAGHRGVSQTIAGPAAMVLANKIDLSAGPIPEFLSGAPVYPISALTGAGFDIWVAALGRRVAELASTVGDAGVITRQRHRDELTRSAEALARAGVAPTLDLMAEEARSALHGIGRLTGAVDVEDLLDVLFADFCIGK